MHAHTHTSIWTHTVTAENVSLLWFLLEVSSQTFSQHFAVSLHLALGTCSYCGSSALSTDWNVLTWLEKIKPAREEMETDVQDRRVRVRAMEEVGADIAVQILRKQKMVKSSRWKGLLNRYTKISHNVHRGLRHNKTRCEIIILKQQKTMTRKQWIEVNGKGRGMEMRRRKHP